ncbi:MAG: DNA photolyase [Gammaproteobacteria bacterium]|jgi:spore photoproduct lyase
MKFSCIYIEEEVRDTPRVEEILGRIRDVPVVPIERYGEVFNRRAQNFRLQKRNPALILAKKHGRLVLPAPSGYGFRAPSSYYFSHMLNCVYDCRYCFLQGMYQSAHYVLFTNYEEFAQQIAVAGAEQKQAVFYSGYDCDSLALEPVSRFISYFVEWFSRQPDLIMEIRTKSTQVRDLLQRGPLQNCVIAMSFMPEEDYQRWEHRVPSIPKRLEALSRLQQQGWPVALRFEPLIYSPDFQHNYARLFEDVFSRLDASKLHSVSIGLFRMPRNFFNRIATIYPDESLFARQFDQQDGQVQQLHDQREEMQEEVEKLLFRYIDKRQYYHCA